MLIILTDPSKWSPADVLSWIRWTSRQFSCPEPVAENWEVSGTDLLTLSDKDFASRAPQVSVFKNLLIVPGANNIILLISSGNVVHRP